MTGAALVNALGIRWYRTVHLYFTANVVEPNAAGWHNPLMPPVVQQDWRIANSMTESLEMAGSYKVGLRAAVWAADVTYWPQAVVPQSLAQLDNGAPHVSLPLGVGLHVGPRCDGGSIINGYGGHRR